MRRTLFAGIALVLTAGLAACSGDSGPSESAPSTVSHGPASSAPASSASTEASTAPSTSESSTGSGTESGGEGLPAGFKPAEVSVTVGGEAIDFSDITVGCNVTAGVTTFVTPDTSGTSLVMRLSSGNIEQFLLNAPNSAILNGDGLTASEADGTWTITGTGSNAKDGMKQANVEVTASCPA
ncbi:lipoprotein LpqH [Propionibacteriaceae bacterium Y2011]